MTHELLMIPNLSADISPTLLTSESLSVPAITNWFFTFLAPMTIDTY